MTAFDHAQACYDAMEPDEEDEMTITVSEDLTSGPRSDFRFCATVSDDIDMERGGFGPTEIATLAMLIDQFPKAERSSLHGASIERVATR